MKYASTVIENGVERVVVVLPLIQVAGFDPENPPQANTYGVEDDVKVGWIKQADGSFAPPESQPPTLADKKLQRSLEVAAIKVMTAAGHIFDGDEASQTRMDRSIATLNLLSARLAAGTPVAIPESAADSYRVVDGKYQMKWILADNTPVFVGIDELAEALALAGAAQLAVWARPYA